MQSCGSAAFCVWIRGEQENKNARLPLKETRRFYKMVGGDLLSHTVSHAVPSTLEGLTTEFGMGSGGPPPHKPPTKPLKLVMRNLESHVLIPVNVLQACKALKPKDVLQRV